MYAVLLNCCCFQLFPQMFSKLHLCLSGVWWCCCEKCFLLHVLLTQCMVQRSLRHDDFDTKNTFCTISIDDCKKVPFIFSALFDADGIPEAISILPVLHDRLPAITCIFILLLRILMCGRSQCFCCCIARFVICSPCLPIDYAIAYAQDTRQHKKWEKKLKPMKLKSFCSYLNSTNKMLDASKILQSIDSDNKWRLKRDNILWNCAFFSSLISIST